MSRDETREAISEGVRALGADIPDTATEIFGGGFNGLSRSTSTATSEPRVEVCRERGGLESEDDLREAHRRGDRSRIAYYEHRLAAMERADRLLPLVGHMMKSGRDAVDQSEARSVLRDDGELVDFAVAHGVLSQNPRGDLSFAIPSFANYMKEWHRDASAHAADRGHVR